MLPGRSYNLYAYAANNPTTWADPTGHFVDSSVYQSPTVLASLLTSAAALLSACLASVGCIALGIAIVVIFLTVACYLTEGCGQLLETIGILGSTTPIGAFVQSLDDLLAAANTHPQTPAVEEPEPVPSPLCCPLWPSTGKIEPEEGQIIYRVYGGRAGDLGLFWTPLDPTAIQHDPYLVMRFGRYAYRAFAGLPDPPVNTGEYLIIARLKNPAAVIPTLADSIETKLNPQSSTWPGGLLSYRFRKLPEPGVDIEILAKDVRLDPPY